MYMKSCVLSRVIPSTIVLLAVIFVFIMAWDVIVSQVERFGGHIVILEAGFGLASGWGSPLLSSRGGSWLCVSWNGPFVILLSNIQNVLRNSSEVKLYKFKKVVMKFDHAFAWLPADFGKHLYGYAMVENLWLCLSVHSFS